MQTEHSVICILLHAFYTCNLDTSQVRCAVCSVGFDHNLLQGFTITGLDHNLS